MFRSEHDVSIPGPQMAYTDLVDHCINQSSDNFHAFPLRPSSAGRCERALAFELAEYLGLGTFEKEKREPNVKRLLGLGSSVEYAIIRDFKKLEDFSDDMLIRYKQQSIELFTLEGGPMPRVVEGSCDLAIMNKDNTSGGILDAKSAKDKFSRAFRTYWDGMMDRFDGMESIQRLPNSKLGWYAPNLREFLLELNDPFFEDNFLQTNLYASSKWAKRHGIDHGSIIRYNKNDSRWVELRFAPCDDLYESVRQKFQRVYTKVMEMKDIEEIKSDRCSYGLGHIKNAFCACHRYAGQDTGEARLQAYFDTFSKRKSPAKVTDEATVKLFNEYEVAVERVDVANSLEKEITKALEGRKANKFELPNGNIYEVKVLKSGGPGGGPRAVLRRSKK